MDNVVDIRCSDLSRLAPIVESVAEHALQEANSHGLPVRVFESYRSLDRQNSLYAQGRTRPGKIITHAKAWQSFHNYGLALDVVFFIDDKWTWDPSLPWDKLTYIFKHYGFTGLDFEKPHFEMNGGLTWQQAFNFVKNKDMQALWDNVFEYYGRL